MRLRGTPACKGKNFKIDRYESHKINVNKNSSRNDRGGLATQVKH